MNDQPTTVPSLIHAQPSIQPRRSRPAVRFGPPPKTELLTPIETPKAATKPKRAPAARPWRNRWLERAGKCPETTDAEGEDGLC